MSGKHAKSGTNKKVFVTVLALVLVITSVIGGTLAWLMDETNAVKNTFTVGNVDITLEETGTTTNNDIEEKSFQMVPGYALSKDPTVTVKANSEKCYVFVKVVESDNLDDFIIYTMANGWTQGNTTNQLPTNVFYRIVDKSTSDQEFDVIGNKGFDGTGTFVADKVLVKTNVTKEMMEALNVTGATQPTLTFTAYACQYYKSNTPSTGDSAGTAFTPKEAWDNVSA